MLDIANVANSASDRLGTYAVAVEAAMPAAGIMAGQSLIAEPVRPSVGDLAILHLPDGQLHVVRPRTSCQPMKVTKGDLRPVVIFDHLASGGQITIRVDEIAQIDRVSCVVSTPPARI